MHKSIELCDGISSEYLEEIKNFIQEWDSQSETIRVFSSGSTGDPKEIFLEKSKVVASAKATGQFFNFKKGQTLLLNLSPKYIAGKLMLVRALEHEMRVLVAPVSQNPLLYVKDNSVDFAAFVPYQVEAILNDPISRALYQKIPQVIIGGAIIPTRVENDLKKLKNDSFATFGMTETITHIALKKIEGEVAFYTCLPGVSIDKDERGCLVINKNAISNRLVTNDLIDKIDFHKFKWLGRFDNVVNSAGVKLSPERLEKQIETIIQANRFYFKGRESEQFGEELVLYIEGESSTNWDDILSEINRQLAAYERPKAVVFVPNFEETKSGKVKRIHYDFG